MATAGGFEIHMELAHAVAPVRADPDVEPAVAARPADVPRVTRPRRPKAIRPALSAAPVIALAIVALLLAGVGTAVVRGRGESTLAMVQAAATRTGDANTAQVSTTVKTDSGPLAKGITVDGGFDFDNRRGSLSIDPSKFGVPLVGRIDSIVDYSSGLVVYMRFPPDMTKELGGKPWVKLDVSALMRKAGVDVDTGSLFQGQSNDPTSGLGLLRGADNVVKIGSEQVRGEDTTHYRLDVSLDKAIADAPTPEAKDAMTKLANLYTVRTFPVEVWLDGNGRLRRFQESLDTAIRLPAGLQTQGNPLQGHVTITYELFDFGSEVDTQIPPADQVTDFAALLKQAGG